MWWKYFERRELSPLKLEDDIDCLANFRRTEKPAYKTSAKAQTLIYQYRYDTSQEFRNK